MYHYLKDIAGVSFVLMAAILILYNISKNNLLIDFEDRNNTIKKQIQTSLSKSLWEIDIEATKIISNSFIKEKSIQKLEIFNEDNESIYLYNNKIKELFNYDYINYQINILKDDSKIGIIIVNFSKFYIHKKLNDLIITNLFFLMLVILTIIVLTIFVFKILLKNPLKDLIKIVSNIDKGQKNNTNFVTIEEFEPLIEILNKMGTKITNHKKDLESKVEERTNQLFKEKQFIQSIMNSINSLIITSDGNSITNLNEKFLSSFNLDSIDDFHTSTKSKYTENENSSLLYLHECITNEDWLDYIYDNKTSAHKLQLEILNEKVIYTVDVDRFAFEGKELYTIVLTSINELEKARKEIEKINKHTRESIEYSSLIQNSLIPNEKVFSDSFVIWEPKDIVGGDIYLFPEMYNEDECVLMLIDCTGHGVPGAFVSMLVKAIEKQITTVLNTQKSLVCPSLILQEFNKEMKSILKQNKKNIGFSAGFDGAVITYNKITKVLKFAGAKLPLYYIKDNKLEIIKGDRHSIGYNTSDENYVFVQHEIKVREGMQFYLSSDGFVDQTGGNKSFSFGRKRFNNMLLSNYEKNMKSQRNTFLEELKEYQQDEEKNDDITFIGLAI